MQTDTCWHWVMHICVSKLTIIGLDNGLSPSQHHAIIWTSAGILLIWTLGTNFSEILIKIITFSFKKMHLKVLSAKQQPFCRSLNVLTNSILPLYIWPMDGPHAIHQSNICPGMSSLLYQIAPMIFQLPLIILPTMFSPRYCVTAHPSLYPTGQLICQLFSIMKDLRFLTMLSGLHFSVKMTARRLWVYRGKTPNSSDLLVVFIV